MKTRKDFISHLQGELDGIKAAGLHKGERLITSNHETLRPRARVRVAEVQGAER